jgi:hypothetical protein
MTIKYKDIETPYMVLPSELPELLLFMKQEGYEPKWDGYRTIEISKPIERFYEFTEAYDKFTGYDKLLEKLLEKTRDGIRTIR